MDTGGFEAQGFSSNPKFEAGVGYMSLTRLKITTQLRASTALAKGLTLSSQHHTRKLPTTCNSSFRDCIIFPCSHMRIPTHIHIDL